MIKHGGDIVEHRLPDGPSCSNRPGGLRWNTGADTHWLSWRTSSPWRIHKENSQKSSTGTEGHQRRWAEGLISLCRGGERGRQGWCIIHRDAVFKMGRTSSHEGIELSRTSSDEVFKLGRTNGDEGFGLGRTSGDEVFKLGRFSKGMLSPSSLFPNGS